MGLMTLEILKQKNPKLDFYSVNDKEFLRYGCVFDKDYSSLISDASSIPYPEKGAAYEASIELLEKNEHRTEIKDELYGEVEIQMGYCWGHNSFLDALEWHKASEVNVAVTDVVLLLAKLDEIEPDGRIASNKVKAFYVPKGTVLEVYGDSLHYCPIQCSDEGFGFVIVLPKGTNTDMEVVHFDKRIFAKNKWLLCHVDNSDLISQGAVAAVYGENYEVKY